MLDRRGFLKAAALGLGALAAARPARAAEAVEALVLADVPTRSILLRRGACDRRFTPASTFKLPLAVMGFDAGILQDVHHPAWAYRPELQAPERDRKTVDPTIWLRDSVVWYSQEITRKLGMARFQRYIDLLGYGNRDLSGNPGQEDGLTRAWLGSSLALSPEEQVQFVLRLLHRDFAVSEHASAMAVAAMPVFEAEDGWTVRGKTGTAELVDPDRDLGWFVGWAERSGRRLAFARLEVPSGRQEGFMGPRVRSRFLRDLPALAL